MKIVSLVLLAALLSCKSALAQGVIANRGALDVLLGSSRADEGFESLPIAPGGAVGSDGLLSSTNSWGGNGLNLVVPGITFESTGTDGNYTIRWAGDNFRGIATRTIAGGIDLRLDFWDPTAAFGIDLKDSPTFRSVNLAGIIVYGADDSTMIYQDNAFGLVDPANGTFFGFQNPTGIGSVVFSVTSQGPFYDFFSPAIDNLAFSTTAVPEPTTLSLAIVAMGALFAIRRRRKP